MAFANAFLGVCHSLAHSLGSTFHIAHGLANALMLSYVIEYNGTDQPTKQGMLPQYKYPWSRDATPHRRHAPPRRRSRGRQPEIRRQKMARLVVAIEQLKKDCHIPASIREAGVSESDFLAKLDVMAEHAFDDQCTVANCRYPLISELKELTAKPFTVNRR